MEDDQPIQLEDRYMNPAAARDFTVEAPSEYLSTPCRNMN